MDQSSDHEPEIAKWANDFYPSAKQAEEQNRNFEALRIYREELRRRQNENIQNRDNMPRNPILEAGHLMHQELANTRWTYCGHCNERWLDMDISQRVKKCKACLNDRPKKTSIPQPDGSVRMVQHPPMFSAANDMHARDPPEVLTCLNQVEQACVSRNAVVIKMYRLRGHALFAKGHIITYPQDLAEFAARLPPLPEDLPIIVVKAPGSPVPLRANKNKILAALQWLVENNPFYEDLEINFDALHRYPNDSEEFVTGLQVIEDPNIQADQANPSTVYTNVDHDLDLTYSTALNEVNCQTLAEAISDQILGTSASRVEGEQTAAAGPPEVLWPTRGKQPVSEWRPGYMSTAFPWLPGFCYGECDLTTARIGKKPSLYRWVCHLLKHPSRAFANDPRFLLAMCNRYLREKALTTGNVFAKNNARDISMAQLKERLANNDEAVVRSLLHFSRSIPGTRQFWKWQANQAYSLVNWVHLTSDGQDTFNLFLTLSFADIHIYELHQLLDPDRTYIDKKVVNHMRDVPAGENPDDYIDKATDYKLRAEAVSRNGDVASYFFSKKLKLLIEEVLKKCLGVVDWIIRCEFQYRSTEHFHMVLRVKDGLSLDIVEEAFKTHEFDIVKDQTNLWRPESLLARDRVGIKRDRVVDFVMNRMGISAVHPVNEIDLWPGPEGGARSAPPVNCLRQTYDDAVETPAGQLQDYIDLLNRTELHTCKKV